MKRGAGAADLEALAHLDKTQVCMLAAHPGRSNKMRHRPPTADMSSMPRAIGLDRPKVERVCGDIDAERPASGYLRLSPLSVHEPKETVPPCAALPE